MEKDVTPAWEAFEIVPDEHSCLASKQLQGRRFLCAETPYLPLPGCAMDRCLCRYEYFADRRGGPRRAEDNGQFSMLLSGPMTERRSRRGRRSTDGS